MKCPNCGYKISSNDELCTSCGVKLSTAFAQRWSMKTSTPSHQQSHHTASYDNIYATLAIIFALVGNALIGIILGIIGYQKAKDYYLKGKTTSILAITLGIIWTLICWIYRLELYNYLINIIQTVS